MTVADRAESTNFQAIQGAWGFLGACPRQLDTAGLYTQARFFPCGRGSLSHCGTPFDRLGKGREVFYLSGPGLVQTVDQDSP